MPPPRGDALDMTNENPKGCGARSADTGASRCRRAPDIDEGGRAAKTRRQQGGRRTHSRSEIGDGDIGGEGEPMGDDESSGSAGIQNRAETAAMTMVALAMTAARVGQQRAQRQWQWQSRSRK